MKGVSKHAWPVKRLRFLTQQGISDKRQKILADATRVTFLPMENIGEQGEIDCSITRDIEDVRNGYTQFFDGDVLVAKITPCFENGKGALVRGTLSGVGFGTTELYVLAPTDEIDARFLYYVTASNSFRGLGEASMFGSAGQKRVPEDFVRDYRVPIPPSPRQRAIADYLDHETVRLDRLVTAKERMLELLAERRQVLIATVVAGGIDSAERSESTTLGVFHEERIRYEVGTNRGRGRESIAGGDGMSTANSATYCKLKYMASINDEVLGEETDQDIDILYVDIGNIDSSGRIGEISEYRFEDAPSRARRRVRDGDVIISTVRTYLQAIAQIQNPPENMIVSTGFAVVRPLSGFDANYCKYVLREREFLSEVEKRSVGVNYPAINAVDLANIPVPTHPLDQQRAIADYLDRETARLDALATGIEDTISLLRERRAALIAAAVAGRIDLDRAA